MENHGRETMTIGALAKSAGVNTSRIRYYEETGLLPQAVRSRAGQRVYLPADLKRLIFVKRSCDFGFPLAEVRKLLALSTNNKKDCGEVAEIAKAHRVELRIKIKELRALEKSLNQFVSDCEEQCCGGASRDCVIFDGLDVG